MEEEEEGKEKKGKGEGRGGGEIVRGPGVDKGGGEFAITAISQAQDIQHSSTGVLSPHTH